MRNPGWTAVVGIVVALTLLLGLASEEPAFAQGVVNFDVDPDTTGNTASSLGTVESCVEITCPSASCTWDGSSTFNDVSDYNIDIVVTGDTQAPVAYDADLNWDRTDVAHVADPGTDTVIKMTNPLGSRTDLSDSRPDSASAWHAGVVYLSLGFSGTAGNGTLVRVGLDIGAAGLVSFGLTPGALTAYASDAGVHETTVDGAQLAINTPCPQEADVKIVSQSLTTPPASMNINTNTDFTVHKVLHNNGPIGPVDVSITRDVNLPADCTVVDVAGPITANLPVSVDVPADEVFTISCSLPSTHALTFTNAIAVTTPGVTDPTPDNNSANTPHSVGVLAEADLAVTGVTVTAPASQNAGVSFAVGATVDVTNNGTYSPVNANVTSTLTLASGCTTGSANPQVDPLVNLGGDTAAPSWNVTCTTEGLKTFTVDASIAVTTTHVSDPNSGNNTGTDSADTTITAPPTTADAQIVSWVFPDDLAAAGNQVRVVPGAGELMTSTETLDNNDGTYPGANYNVDLTVTETPAANCAATPDGGNPTTQVIPTNGTDVVDTLAWQVTLTAPATSCTIDFGKTVTITTAGVTDSDLSDNTATRTVTLVADTDNDTVPDNFNGVIDNCPTVANPLQENNDGDALGDACDDDDDNDTVLDVTDNCPLVANADQLDSDGNGVGDACENDFDGDTVPDLDDNCPAVANPTQTDTDGDNVGNACDNCASVPNTNQLDTDGDGIGDACEVAPTATPTATSTTVVTETPTGTATGTTTPVETGTPPAETCAPVIPGTYNGLVRLDGVPAADGFVVTASIDGTAWGDAIVSGGRYALDIPETLPASPPCFEGGTITFTLDGGVCDETPDWASGLHDLDLHCAEAPPPTPTPPVQSVTPPAATGTPPGTPVAPPKTGGGGLSPLNDMSWATGLAAVAVLTWVLAAAGLFHTIRRRAG
jgi:hypothetical protein